MGSITLRSPAKINLCLCVTGKRPDGYHDVEMLMQMVGLFDTLTVTLGGKGVRVQCDSMAVPSGEKNIAWKAAVEMLKESGRDDGVAIEIVKNIPVAAGLGGGSGNAAAVIAALNMLLNTQFDMQRLSDIGSRIGMDVPFFFHGPTALASGRGEMLTKLAPLPKFWVLLINPGFETSTAWVYKNVNLRLTKKVDCNKISRLQLQNIAEGLHNDLETVTIPAHPVIGRIKTELLARGAVGSLMSGSGPTVFGVFETEDTCRSAAHGLSQEGWKIYPVETLITSPVETGRSG
jgi:4-diphosphocytidyl-2-C-methyl-D-erythritol kinase